MNAKERSEEFEDQGAVDDLNELELCRKKVWEIHMMLVNKINYIMEEKKKQE